MNVRDYRPSYVSMELADAQSFKWRAWHLSEKLDGVFAVRQFNGCTVTGEAMRNGRFYAWDIVTAFGEDVRRRQWPERNAALETLFASLPEKLNWHRPAAGHGVEFLETILANGGEGCVAKPLDGFFVFNFIKIKRVETHDCMVAEKHPEKMSVRLEFNGEDCGWCPALFSLFDRIAVGSIVEVVAYGRHASGKFREARIIRIRTDKEAM